MTNGKLHIQHLGVPKGYNSNELIVISDVHWGSPECDEEFFQEVLDWGLEEKNRFFIGLGDMCELATERKKGLLHQKYSPDVQRDDMVDLLRPLANRRRLIGLHRGNHEKRYLDLNGDDVTRSMARRLNVKYFGGASTQIFNVGQCNSYKDKWQAYSAHMIHGRTGSRYIRTKMHACQKLQEIVKNADMYIMAHTHSLAHIPIQAYEIDKYYQTKKFTETHFILTGGYLLYDESYAEEAGLPPVGKSGSPNIKLHGDKYRISVKL